MTSLSQCQHRSGTGLMIQIQYFSNFRFTGDILICANTPHELQQMLQELADESENRNLKMKKSKAKNDTDVCQHNSDINL